MVDSDETRVTGLVEDPTGLVSQSDTIGLHVVKAASSWRLFPPLKLIFSTLPAMGKKGAE
jgi:hypothetical protein